MIKSSVYTTKWLLDAISAGASPSYFFFWGHRSKEDGRVTKSCFSQWWPSSFNADGTTFLTAEHWMMAQKSKLFGDEEVYEEIINTVDAKTVKALGRKVRNFDAKIWDQEKYEVVVKGNFLKFSQNKDLKKYLLFTKDAVIVEASPVDKIWGIGLAQDHKDVVNPNKWKGLNLLGFALMSVRDQLMS